MRGRRKEGKRRRPSNRRFGLAGEKKEGDNVRPRCVEKRPLLCYKRAKSLQMEETGEERRFTLSKALVCDYTL